MILPQLDTNNYFSHQAALFWKSLVSAYDEAPVLRPHLVIIMICDEEKQLEKQQGVWPSLSPMGHS